MYKIFIPIYRFFRSHRWLMYICLIISTLCFGYFGSKIQLEENILKLLPNTGNDAETDVAFGNMKVKDKIFIQLAAAPGYNVESRDLAVAQDEFLDSLGSDERISALISNCLYKFDEDDIMNALYYLMSTAPDFIPIGAYDSFDTLLTAKTIDRMAASGTDLLSGLDTGYAMVDGHLFSPDSTVALAYISPTFNSSDSKTASEFVSLINRQISRFKTLHPDIEVLYHGAAIGAAANSRCIKRDLILTVGISLLVILILLGICFKGIGSIVQLLSPVLYGTLFSMACVYWIKGGMSLIAMGACAIVLGVALSYCLHVFIHYKYVTDPEQVIREQATPVCMGCVTTVGAFCGLMLTSSDLLRDFGIFASFAMLGTTLFALIFLPHFLSTRKNLKSESAFRLINRINAYPVDRNKPVAIALAAVIAICLAASFKVGFDSNLDHINYRDADEIRSSELYTEKVNHGFTLMYYAGYSKDLDSAIVFGRALTERISQLKDSCLVESFSSATPILHTEREQLESISAWKSYWTPERIDRVEKLLQQEQDKYGWDVGMDIPSTFRAVAESDFEPTVLCDAAEIPQSLVSNFIELNEDGYLVFTSALVRPENVRAVSEAVTELDNVTVADPFFYAGDMVKVLHGDFKVVLMVSSLFVFLVLLLSYRSLVAAIIAFLPMFVSWYAVEGVMAIAGVEFNLINIMLSSFVFGIGVDYSIFVMDGLVAREKSKSMRLMACHKTAILISATILIVVTGSLLFATHPSIRSVGFCTIVGMTFTVLITYVLEPIAFKLCMKNGFIKSRILK